MGQKRYPPTKESTTKILAQTHMTLEQFYGQAKLSAVIPAAGVTVAATPYLVGLAGSAAPAIGTGGKAIHSIATATTAQGLKGLAVGGVGSGTVSMAFHAITEYKINGSLPSKASFAYSFVAGAVGGGLFGKGLMLATGISHPYMYINGMKVSLALSFANPFNKCEK